MCALNVITVMNSQVHIKEENQSQKKKLADGWGKMATSKSGQLVQFTVCSAGLPFTEKFALGIL